MALKCNFNVFLVKLFGNFFARKSIISAIESSTAKTKRLGIQKSTDWVWSNHVVGGGVNALRRSRDQWR